MEVWNGSPSRLPWQAAAGNLHYKPYRLSSHCIYYQQHILYNDTFHKHISIEAMFACVLNNCSVMLLYPNQICTMYIDDTVLLAKVQFTLLCKNSHQPSNTMMYLMLTSEHKIQLETINFCHARKSRTQKRTYTENSNKYSKKMNCAAIVPISTCICERFIYSHHRSVYSAAGNMWTDPENI
jgi:hypothetical protein